MMIRVSRFGALAFTALVAVAACSDDATNPADIENSDVPDAGTTPEGDAAPAPGTPALYALAVNTFTLSARTSYVQFVDSLDNQPDTTLAQAREFPNYASLAAAGGKLLVGSGDTPTVSRFAIGADKSWTDDGAISFSAYASAPVLDNIVVSGNVAFAPVDAATYVRWDPQTFALGATAALPTTLVPATQPGGYALNRGFAYLVSGNLAYQTFNYANPSFTYEKTSYIGVLDAAANAWTSAIAVDCPHLFVASADDSGNLWFSPSIGSVATAETDATAPRNCLARVRAGSTTLDGAPVFFKDLTDGREGSNFFYAGGNLGIFSVYHRERATPAELADPQRFGQSSNFHLWTLDLGTNTAKMTEGIGFGGGQSASFRFDGRTFIAFPTPDYSSTTIYEITAGGRAERRFSAQGWVYNVVKVR